jgi:hypothetical protein
MGFMKTVILFGLVVGLSLGLSGCGRREGDGPELRDVESYVEYALDLAERGESEAASWHLTNALMFGHRSKEIEQHLSRLPQLGSSGISLMRNGEFDPEAQRMVDFVVTYTGGIDMGPKELAGMVSVSPVSDQIEARMLLDQELVGDGKCQPGGFEGVQMLVFLRQNRLSIAAAKERYGEPTRIHQSQLGGEYVFWGRFLIFRPVGEDLPGVFRLVR